MAEPRIDHSKRSDYHCFSCGKAFSRLRCTMTKSSRAFCSRACAWKGRHQRPRLLVDMECLVCGRRYGLRPSYAIHSIACSRTCLGVWNSRRRRQPIETPKQFYGRRARRAWRKAVLQRYGSACVRCGALEDVHAHHVVPVRKALGRALDVENGQPLCSRCHRTVEPIRYSILGAHEAEVLSLFNSRATLKQIADRFGVTREAVSSFIRRRTPKDTHKHRTKIPDEHVRAIRSMRSDGVTLALIAEKYGISFQHVSAIVN